MCLMFLIGYQKFYAQLKPKTFDELATLSLADLSLVDTARMNLLCAKGLPGTENLDVDEMLVVIDKWVAIARAAEKKYLPNFYKAPDKYDNSLSKFKAITLALTLQDDLRLKYNMELVRSGVMADVRSTRFFRDPRDLFINGFVEKRSGTCASIPVLIVSIGRRLGYPLYLVTSKGHLFCRWSDNHESFNVETSFRGVNTPPDSYFRTFPNPCTDDEVQTEHYLKNLTPAEELAIFAETRGMCLKEHGCFQKADNALEITIRAFPNLRHIFAYRDEVRRKMRGVNIR
jgi:hypothetical protein